MDKVLEFDALRNSMEEWCIQQQEVIDQLAPLEVTEQQLLTQQEECQTLSEIAAHHESIQKLESIAMEFLKDTEVHIAKSCYQLY